METTIKNFESISIEHLVENFNKALEIIQEKVKEKGWRLSWKELSDIKIEEKDLLKSLISQNSRKKFRNKINRVLKKGSLKSINSLLNYGFKIISPNTESQWKVKISEKEEAIQKARKNWKEAQVLADQYLKVYKEEKGDFYKK
ncbi:MAG: hypothetical protein PHF86_00180 [Candidatus Nanoarchaeia archaeon]|nr:hypothetical protein [Candidatus Nanoarchaeia archaeon]